MRLLKLKAKQHLAEFYYCFVADSKVLNYFSNQLSICRKLLGFFFLSSQHIRISWWCTRVWYIVGIECLIYRCHSEKGSSSNALQYIWLHTQKVQKTYFDRYWAVTGTICSGIYFFGSICQKVCFPVQQYVHLFCLLWCRFSKTLKLIDIVMTLTSTTILCCKDWYFLTHCLTHTATSVSPHLSMPTMTAVCHSFLATLTFEDLCWHNNIHYVWEDMSPWCYVVLCSEKMWHRFWVFCFELIHPNVKYQSCQFLLQFQTVPIRLPFWLPFLCISLTWQFSFVTTFILIKLEVN